MDVQPVEQVMNQNSSLNQTLLKSNTLRSYFSNLISPRATPDKTPDLTGRKILPKSCNNFTIAVQKYQDKFVNKSQNIINQQELSKLATLQRQILNEEQLSSSNSLENISSLIIESEEEHLEINEIPHTELVEQRRQTLIEATQRQQLLLDQVRAAIERQRQR